MYEDAFADGGFVKIIFSLPDSDADAATGEDADEDQKTKKFSSSLMTKVEETPKVRTGLLQVPANLLTSSSPIFAIMLGQDWRESNERCIHVQKFDFEDFRVFVDCLFALANATVLPKIGILLDNPKLLRQVLPIAHYYQVNVLKETIFETVLLPGTLQKISVVEVTELVLAVESSLPEEEVPDWPMAVLQALNYYFQRLKQDCLKDATSEACIEDLSLKTLRRMLTAPDRFDEFVDHFLHRLEWDDLLKPTTFSDTSFTQTSSGPQYIIGWLPGHIDQDDLDTEARTRGRGCRGRGRGGMGGGGGNVRVSAGFSSRNNGHPIVGMIPWKENLKSALNEDRDTQRERHLSLSLEDSVSEC